MYKTKLTPFSWKFFTISWNLHLVFFMLYSSWLKRCKNFKVIWTTKNCRLMHFSKIHHTRYFRPFLLKIILKKKITVKFNMNIWKAKFARLKLKFVSGCLMKKKVRKKTESTKKSHQNLVRDIFTHLFYLGHPVIFWSGLKRVDKT